MFTRDLYPHPHPRPLPASSDPRHLDILRFDNLCGSHLQSQSELYHVSHNHIAEHHLQTKPQIDWDSATCITYSKEYYQRLTLESWFTNK